MNAWNAMSSTTFFALVAVAIAALSILAGCLIVLFRHDDYDLDQEAPDEAEEQEGWTGPDDETRMLDMWPDVPALADPDIAGALQPLPADPGLSPPLLPARGSTRSASDVRDRESTGTGDEWEPSPADDIARWAAHAAPDEHLAALDELDAAFLRYDMSGAYRAYQELSRDAWRAEMGLQPAETAIFA